MIKGNKMTKYNSLEEVIKDYSFIDEDRLTKYQKKYLLNNEINSIDENYNINCKNCKDCENCIDCTDCNLCTDCLRCNDCENCLRCENCENCENCIDCTDYESKSKMTKTLEQIQEENRKAIIMANHPEAKSYEEALEMELGFGCKFYSELDTKNIVTIYDITTEREFKVFLGRSPEPFQDIRVYHDPLDSKIGIIGKPLTLNRALIALQSAYEAQFVKTSTPCKSCFGILFESIVRYTEEQDIDIICNWDLTKETLEEQSEDCQRKINELLNDKSETQLSKII